MTNKIIYTWDQFARDIDYLAESIRSGDCQFENIYGIPRGGVPVAVALADRLGLPLTTTPTAMTLVVDDLVDSGATMARFPGMKAVLHVKPHSPRPNFWLNELDGWVVYPWEETPEQSIRDNIVRLLQYIGEDPQREGLIKTPDRIVRSWDEIFGGYKIDPASIFTTFEADGYNELVLLKGIEFYSTCEHHWLSFAGRAHIGYIAKGKIVGISKLARLLDIYAKRLQIQERIGQQVTQAIEKYLNPGGAACIIEAKHLCMCCRGVEKQNSVMVTSSLTGVFLEEPSARAELFSLIRP